MDNKNFLVFLVLSIGIMIFWSSFVVPPPEEQIPGPVSESTLAQPGTATAPGQDLAPPGSPQTQAGINTGGIGITGTGTPFTSRERALAQTERVIFDNASMDGSISLTGAVIDDVRLKDYRETLDPESPEIDVLSPRGAQYAYFASFGWAVPQGWDLAVPDINTQWTQVSTGALTPENPLVIEWDNGQGLVFQRTISIDDTYLFSVEQAVQNNSDQTITLQPFGFVQRKSLPETQTIFILHEGFIGVFNGAKTEKRYNRIRKDVVNKGMTEPFVSASTGGWIGMTDKYWMAALVPDQEASIIGRYRYGEAADLYQSSYIYENFITIPEGQTVSVSNDLFAGAKKKAVLDMYRNENGFDRFDLAIDWGNLFFITRPLFYLLEFFGNAIGNFGVSILIVTVLIKLVFFPLANKSYEAMSKMKKLQPKMIELRERYADDKVRMQQELMEIYKKEKVNPAAGCLPILVQIPVFFALYKVLYVTIEMRHAPFFGWVQDLSAPDPTSIFNLFGLIPWEPAAVPVIGSLLAIGVWPIIMGITMMLQMKMNPPPADPIQERIFGLMPYVFTILLASFPAGLVIYWTWNNFLSLIQQYVIMRKMGVEVELAKNLKLDKLTALFGGGAAKPSYAGGPKEGPAAATSSPAPSPASAPASTKSAGEGSDESSAKAGTGKAKQAGNKDSKANETSDGGGDGN